MIKDKKKSKTALSKTEKTKKNKKIKVAELSGTEARAMARARSYGMGQNMRRRLDTLNRQVETGLISVSERQAKLDAMSRGKKYGE